MGEHGCGRQWVCATRVNGTGPLPGQIIGKENEVETLRDCGCKQDIADEGDQLIPMEQSPAAKTRDRPKPFASNEDDRRWSQAYAVCR